MGILILCVLDLTLGLSRDTYDASWKEWMCYGLGAILVVAIVRSLIANTQSAGRPTANKMPKCVGSYSLDWTTLEPWLYSDTPASHDFLGNCAVAERLGNLLLDGTRSIGIVAPFGSGKSSVVSWINALVEDNKRVLLSEHSCWGFETSSASIHAMLADAIGRVAERIDTFQVRSLPDSYTQTFAADGDYLDKILKIISTQRDPIEQFRCLSNLLIEMDVRLIFVVEDLDRNDNRSFDLQEVIAFLQRLKRFPNFSFILTGGLSGSQKIDYAKLCDHIEYLATISAQQSGSLVAALRQRCLDREAFPHVNLSSTAHDPWQSNPWLILLARDQLDLSEAIARLLNTPRALRHALGLTYRAWRNLFGEIDFDHLLALNVLRYAAPEAFSFVLRHWHRFNRRLKDVFNEYDRLDEIRSSLGREWEQVCVNVDWDAKAARKLIDFILPESQTWLSTTNTADEPRPQGIQREKYWQRALNQSIASDAVRDQTVIRDIQQWLMNPVDDSAMVMGICSNSHYSDIWEELAVYIISNDRRTVFRLSSQVLDVIRRQNGAVASKESQGFSTVCKYASLYVEKHEENALWLEEQITEAASVSLELVNSLWHYWAAGNQTILRRGDLDRVRRHLIKVLQQKLNSAKILEQVLHPSFRHIFYQLVFDPGEHTPVQAGPENWAWIGKVILTGLQEGQVTTAVAACELIASKGGSNQGKRPTADPELLRAFFGNHALEAVDAIQQLIPKMNESDRAFVYEICQSGKTELGS
jgi:hypothetical protein